MQSTITFPPRIVDADALEAGPAFLAQHGFGRTLLLVCDDATWVAAGQKLNDYLAEYDVRPYSLGRNPKASTRAIPELLHAAQEVDGLIAVGSGTINDMTKYVAHQVGKPYLAVPTAASMNGYTSATASLDVDGHKHSFRVTAPSAVLVDLRVVAAAPRKMARAGLGDTLCRGTVEADCFLSHIVRNTPYPREIFARLRQHESLLMSQVDQIKEHTLPYLRLLMTALLDTGDAMHETGSSAVASQGEHMIAHTAEMLYANELRYVLHGEIIAVTSTTMAHLQHKILHAAIQLKAVQAGETKFIRVFGRHLGPGLLREYSKKQLAEDAIAEANARLARDWNDIKAELLAIMPPASSVERVFKLAGMASTAKQMGLNVDCYNAAVTYAHLTRDRFTFLDLAAMNIRRSW